MLSVRCRVLRLLANLRATKTLALRMEAHGRNALRIATALTETDGIERVIYPGLATHPQHDLACKQQLTPYGQPGFGGIISFVVRDFMSAQRILKRFKIFTLAESLGGVESLVCHPASMTHASVPKTMREEIGLSDGLIRLSVGVEDVEDLLKDVSDAIQGADAAICAFAGHASGCHALICRRTK